jgi:hypothetical protein
VKTPKDPTTSGTPSAAGGTAAPQSGPSVYRTRLSFGADKTAAVRGVSRLEPLGDLSNPALLYLGTTADHQRAMFLLGPNAIADGEGDCAEKSCRIIGLKAGQSAVVGVQGQDGGEARTFTLVVDAIAGGAVADEAAALKQRARVHHDGRDVLREMIKDAKTAAAIGQFTYDRSLGAVVKIPAP